MSTTRESSRATFERTCREQNARRAEQRAEARATGAPCIVTTMFAFGGIDYCTTHGVMGTCPYAAERAS